MELSKSDLGFLGADFEYKFVKALMEDNNLFRDLYSILDQNKFTVPLLKLYVSTMKDYYNKYETFPSYEMMGISLNSVAKTDLDKDTYIELNQKVRSTSLEGVEEIRELGIKFFRQQNIVRAANKILSIAGEGDMSKYEQCIDILQDALSKGASYNLGERLFDELGETLAEDYREPIPTGIGKLDEALNGGLGKGELGVLIGSSGYGKVQPYDAIIMTPKGPVKNKYIKEGDYVLGKDGKPVKVLKVFPHKNWKFYNVTFSDGTSCECGMEHLWSVKKKGCSFNSYKTLSLNKIANSKFEEYSIPICDKAEFNNDNTVSNPITYGQALGFSSKTCPNISISTSNLYSNSKFRERMLLGLMEYNGSIDENGYCVFCCASYYLTKDVRKLVLSLGGIIINDISKETPKTKDISFGRDLYYFTFALRDENILVFKDEKLQSKVKYEHDYERCFKSIKFSRICDGQCILVDSKDHLYLTNDFIVTHNTSCTTAMANYASTYKCAKNLDQGYKVLQIVFEDGVKAIKRKHISRLTNIEACNLSKPEYINKVKEMISNCPDYELLQQNLRILPLPSGEATATRIKELIKKMINIGFKPDLTIIDYFECVDLGDIEKGENEFNREGKVMRKFEYMAKELDMALWITLQGTKDSVNADIVTMDKAGGSFKKVQIAHVVASIARTQEDIKNNKATLALLKNRAGGSGAVWTNVSFNNGTCRISTDDVEDYEDMFEYNKMKDKKEMDLQVSIFKKMRENRNKDFIE